jgi:hypothetical protein
VTGGDAVDRLVDLDTVLDDGGDQFAGQIGCHRITFRVGEMALQDGLGGSLAEVGLEDRGEREPAPDPTSALAVSLRRHRR